MNHPTIANNNALLRYKEMLREANQYRLERMATKRHNVPQIINLISNLFI